MTYSLFHNIFLRGTEAANQSCVSSIETVVEVSLYVLSQKQKAFDVLIYFYFIMLSS